MNSDQIFQVIEQIAATSSKNEKQAIVSAHIGDADFKRVLVAALDPLTTYGIAKRPEITLAGLPRTRLFDAGTWELLSDLAERRLTGNNAIDSVRGEMMALTPESAELFWRIIAKDLRAGFSESTVNKAAPGTIKDFPYMRCSLLKDVKLDEWDIPGQGAISQEKADGMFVNITHEEGGVVTLTTRQGTPIPLEAFGQLVTEIRARLKPGTQTHGEMLVLLDGHTVAERQIGNGILNSVIQGGTFSAGEWPLLKVWDQIPLSAVKPKGKHTVPYRDRLADLFKQLKATSGQLILPIDTRIVRSMSEAFAHYRECLAQGKEGTILKRMTAIWRDGTSKDQVKLKLEADVDLKVTAIVPGRAGTKNEGRAGSLTCVTSCGQLKVDVAVKNEAMRDQVDANPDDWLERIITVRANSIMPPSDSNSQHSLFLPRMVEACYRLDKTDADSLERVRDQFEAAIKAA